MCSKDNVISAFMNSEIGKYIVEKGYSTEEIIDALLGKCEGTGTFACNQRGFIKVQDVIQAYTDDDIKTKVMHVLEGFEDRK